MGWEQCLFRGLTAEEMEWGVGGILVVVVFLTAGHTGWSCLTNADVNTGLYMGPSKSSSTAGTPLQK